MKIAISTDGDLVSAHFGRCPHYTIVEIKNSAVKNKELVANPGHEPGKIPEFLNSQGVNIIVAGGMGPRAVGFFQEYNIEVVVGKSGLVETVIQEYIDGKLVSGQSTCTTGGGRGYGIPKDVCDH